ncbi:MAG: acyltransferase, partial [Actinobacteria bacterium]|nr:acyltransferase [Actinomycetota bacterium]
MAKLTTKGETSAQKSGFRADIAGLRGVAVLLVLLCHFQIPGFGGGFIGPDIFFVISGYLITGLLVKEYASSIAARSRGRQDSDEAVKGSTKSRRGKISFSGFYLRRARRILPASILVVVCINVYALVNLNVLQSAQIKN